MSKVISPSCCFSFFFSDMGSKRFLLVFVLLTGFNGVFFCSGERDMEEGELLGLFQVMGLLLEDSSWAEAHPSPCSETPWPGVECELLEGTSLFHVTQIHVGPDIVDPPCKNTSKLSASLHSLPYLKTLSLISCFTVFPFYLTGDVFESMPSLETLVLESNPGLAGEIPPTISNLEKLTIFCMSQNNLSGEIPPEIGKMLSLEQLDLSHNKLSGRIPEEIGSLRSLGILDLSWNFLEDSVPATVGEMQWIEKIDLSFNKLRGEIPQDFGKLMKLTLLDLSHNSLTGPIPENFSSLHQLQYLIMEDNPLNTTLPSFLGSLSRLRVASFSDCRLTGQIPTTVSGLTNLTALSLDNNLLTGGVPSEIGRLENLNTLNLSRNHLTGELSFPPDFLNRLGERLDIRENSGLCSNQERESRLFQIPSCLNPSNRTASESNHSAEGDSNVKPKAVTGSTEQRDSAQRSELSHSPFLFSISLLLICFI